ncbi:MAG: methyltransferase [Clostridia bacterium]|nr:methyltransferase [Clostridia bacterium]
MTAFISKRHGFGTDAVLLADFAAPSKKSVCCDLGTGCGIIPLLWCKKEGGKITAVEISAEACGQAELAVAENKLENRLTVINSDLRDLKGKVEGGSFDIVTMNPPYKAQGTGIESASESDRIARHGIECTLDDMCLAASKLLKYSGKLCVCLRPERTAELFKSMQKYSIEPKRLRYVSKCHGAAPWLVLCEGRLGGKPGMTVEPQFAVYEGDEYSPAMKAIYSDYLFENRGDELER